MPAKYVQRFKFSVLWLTTNLRRNSGIDQRNIPSQQDLLKIPTQENANKFYEKIKLEDEDYNCQNPNPVI